MEIQPIILAELKRHRDIAVSHAHEQYEQMQTLFAACESPLEQSFLLSVINHTNAYYCDYHAPHVMTQCYGEPHWNGFTLRIVPQYSLSVDSGPVSGERVRYRPDFLILLFPPWNPRAEVQGLDMVGTACCKLVAEVDGHDFHERTKEQAQRDKSRDRDLQAAGFTVFRFTGREVFREVDDKVGEVLGFLNARCSDYARRANLRFYDDSQNA